MIVFLLFMVYWGAIAAGVAHWRGGPAVAGLVAGVLLGPIGVLIAFLLPLEMHRFETQADASDDAD